MRPRSVTLALVDPHGRPLGLLPLSGTTPSPWWKDVDDVVDLARVAAGIDVTVLRLLTAEGLVPAGGPVTYVAEYDGAPPAGLVPSNGDWTAPEPLRLPWAQPGGPAATIVWATGVLAAQGRTVVGCRQRRSWNLSSIWQLETDAGSVWTKEVPPFFAHEGALLRWLARPNTPRVLGVDLARVLMADVPGDARHTATPDERVPMLTDLLDIQVSTVDRLPELLALGVPGIQAEAFGEQIADVVEWEAGPDERAALDGFVARLPQRFAELAACGVPDTLVHGDFHPGNVLVDGASRVIIDWGDGVVGHPALDLVRMRDWDMGGTAPGLTKVWCEYWRERAPGSEPEHAVELVEPLAALRDVLVYRNFTRSVEPAERVYHQDDALDSLRRAVSLLKTPPGA